MRWMKRPVPEITCLALYWTTWRGTTGVHNQAGTADARWWAAKVEGDPGNLLEMTPRPRARPGSCPITMSNVVSVWKLRVSKLRAVFSKADTPSVHPPDTRR